MTDMPDPPEPAARRCVAIMQSSYIPWKGYFDMIAAADAFILFDDVQFTRRDWRSRNRIKTAQGPRWLTIPVKTKSRYTQLIQETEVAADWTENHWTRIRHAYGKAPHFADNADAVESLYARAAGMSSLSEINRLFLSAGEHVEVPYVRLARREREPISGVELPDLGRAAHGQRQQRQKDGRQYHYVLQVSHGLPLLRCIVSRGRRVRNRYRVGGGIPSASGPRPAMDGRPKKRLTTGSAP